MPGLLERERELARISRFLDRARTGVGGALLVGGAAGIGKSSLLAAARDRAAEAGMRVLRARGGETEREFGFGVVRQLFEPALVTASESERVALLDAAAGRAARLLGLPGAGGDPETLSDAVDPSFQVLHGLYWLCAQLSETGPVCLLVDDAQWADRASLRFLAFLLPRLDELPVAVLVAVRAGEAGAAADLLTSLAADPACEVLEPAPLSPPGVGQLLRAPGGAPPDPEVVRRCHVATGGNPFLVEQLVGRLREGDEASGLDTILESPVGPAVDRWVQARLARLGEAPARLGNAVAVLETASLVQAAGLAGLDVEKAADACDVLIDAHMLSPDRVLTFIHPLVRSAVYDAIGRAGRTAGHRRAARLLAEAGAPSETVAEHLLATDPAGDDWAVDRLTAAAGTATRAGAPESAIAYLSRAVAEPPSPDRRYDVLLELSLAEINAGRPEALRHLHMSVDAAPDAARRASAAALVVCVLAAGRDDGLADSVHTLDDAIDSLRPADEPLAGALDTFAASVTRLDPSLSGPNRSRVEAIRRRADDPHTPRDVLILASVVALVTNEPAEAVADLVRRSLRCEAAPLPGPVAAFRESFLILQVAPPLTWSEAPEAPEYIEAAITQARESGDALVLATSLTYRAWLAWHRGDLRGVEVDVRTALETPAMPVAGYFRVYSASVLVMALVEMDRLDEADAELSEHAQSIEREDAAHASLRLARGRLRMAQHRPADALADFLRADGATLRQTWFDSPATLPWRSHAALAHLALGERERARELAVHELELARTFGAPRTLGVALRVAGLATEGPDGEQLLRDAIDTLGRGGAALDQAYARYDLGARLRRDNRRAASRDLLRAALDVADHLGASALAARALTELHASGARPRRTVVSGPDALTASERRVADLAADGASNRQIAQTLFVTARTVESHLTNVFRKLGIASRDELGAALAT